MNNINLEVRKRGSDYHVQKRKGKEDAKLEKIQNRGGPWWGDSEPRNQLT